LLLTGFFVLISLSNGGISGFSVVALMSSYGVSFETANVALTAFLGAGAVGVLAGGLLADRTVHHGHVAAACFAANAVIIASVALLSPSPAGVVLLMATAGFLGGVIAPSRDMLVRKAAPAGAIGSAFGLVSTGFNIGGIIAPMLYGFIMDQGMARGVFGVAVGFMLVAVLLTLAIESMASRQRRG
jgi:MFS family permease